jgi:hypothetical protein
MIIHENLQTVKTEYAEAPVASQELINEVDQVFVELIDHLDTFPISPELEAEMGPWAKNCMPTDSTEGTPEE